MELKNKTQKMVMVGVMAAVLAVLSQISIPMPSGVPITLQTFAVALTGYLLGHRLSLTSISVYILIGASGIPVFSNFRGGLSMLTGPTGGFIFGFLLMAALCGLGLRFNRILAMSMGLLGLIFCHIAGVFQFSLVTATGFWASALIVSVPYLIKDIISVLLAYGAASAIALALEKSGVIRAGNTENNVKN